MSSSQKNRSLTNKEAGVLAEIFVSDTRYRDALNVPYLHGDVTPTETTELHAHQEAADNVLANTIKNSPYSTPEIQRWQAGRHAVLSLLSRQALGSFESYFLGPDSILSVSEAEPEILPNGEYKVVDTNNRIVRYSKSIDDPREFLDTSLGVIQRQKKIGPDSFGPENYATALKLFSDKYSSLEHNGESVDTETLSLPDLEDVKRLVNESLQGFFTVALRDAPNYLEMTNIYASIRALPKGVIDAKYTHDILVYTADNMDQFDTRASRVLLAAISKIDTSEYPLAASAIVNMTLHRAGDFQTTRDLRTTIRAIDSLQKNAQTDAALKIFFELSEGFDKPLELDGIDEVIDRFNHVLGEVTDSPELSIQTKNFAHKCMAQANHITRHMLASGNMTKSQMDQLRQTYTRIRTNYQSL